MNQYLRLDPWKIIEEGFHARLNRVSESLFSLGNGKMGQRGNFEETFTGESLKGHYIAGVYYPDKTRVGWWKIGYPKYFAKVPNAPSWIGIRIEVEGEELDLHRVNAILEFHRELDMREGILRRRACVELQGGRRLEIYSQRFCSLSVPQDGAIRYALRPLNFSGACRITLTLDGDIRNSDANYEEKFWEGLQEETQGDRAWLLTETRISGFRVCTAMASRLQEDGRILPLEPEGRIREKYAALSYNLDLLQGKEYAIYKYASVHCTLDQLPGSLVEKTHSHLDRMLSDGFDQLILEQRKAWERKWETMDLVIEGDVAAQQGIRFNIFQLHQTYSGQDARLNIGPKGFTGEKYGGATYWDTEAFCLPFYLGSAEPKVARNLLQYRYRQLDQAIRNARKLGFDSGAALFPMVTITGEECHNEWEITFEEIHRNGAIAFAIWNYCQYTGDWSYLLEAGLEVLIAIARFWAQRVSWSEAKSQYVLLGVTGPNEYENNVNNNWYTNYLACWCLEFTDQSLDRVRELDPEALEEMLLRISFREEDERNLWCTIRSRMYFPVEENLGILLQQEDYMDKVQSLVRDLPPTELPLHQHWSWDRILRSCFIKQADVLQGLLMFEERFDPETIKRNFEFYEPRTVHESSLSPCVHSILAARIGDRDKAYQLYLRTARLDLDNYNQDTGEGCHITSMAGTWMSIVHGFAGLQIRSGMLHLAPFLPGAWTSYRFRVLFRGALLLIEVSASGLNLENHGHQPAEVIIFDKACQVPVGQSRRICLKLI